MVSLLLIIGWKLFIPFPLISHGRGLTHSILYIRERSDGSLTALGVYGKAAGLNSLEISFMEMKAKLLSGAMLEEHLWFEISSNILRYSNGQMWVL